MQDYIEPEDSTRNLLLKQGITYDKSSKKGRCYMLVKDGIELGYFSADSAHEKFIKNVR